MIAHIGTTGNVSRSGGHSESAKYDTKRRKRADADRFRASAGKKSEKGQGGRTAISKGEKGGVLESELIRRGDEKSVNPGSGDGMPNLRRLSNSG